MTPDEKINYALSLVEGATPLNDYPGYAVTSDGRVYSLTSNWRGSGVRELSQRCNSDGYPSVRLLSKDGARKHIATHRLVAGAYLPPRPSADHQIRHINGVKTDNRAENLCWGTAYENAQDRAAHGRTVMWDRMYSTKLTPEDVREIRSMAQATPKKVLARMFGVDPKTIRQLLNGETWKSVA